MNRNLRGTPYVQHVANIPLSRTDPEGNPVDSAHTRGKSVRLYLVSNDRFLEHLNIPRLTSALRLALTHQYGHSIDVRVTRPTFPVTSAPRIDSMLKYDLATTTDLKNELDTSSWRSARPPYHPSPATLAHDNLSFTYTDGSLVSGNPILGAALTDPSTNTTIRIRVQAQPARHTINRAELAAIAVTLNTYKDRPTLKILTDSAFCINSIRNYMSNPARYTDHLHQALLSYTDNILKYRHSRQFHTHIGKVKSHIGITYNEVADEGATSVVRGIDPDITFSEADPPITGLRTWINIKEDDSPETPPNPYKPKTGSQGPHH